MRLTQDKTQDANSSHLVVGTVGFSILCFVLYANIDRN